MNILTSYETGKDSNGADIGVNSSARVRREAQSFEIPTDGTIEGVALYISNAGATRQATVRIETDDGDKPSGTLAHADATATFEAAELATFPSFDWLDVAFVTPFALSAGTKYWIVVKLTSEVGADEAYIWGMDASSPTYADGHAKIYTTGTWEASYDENDLLFKVYGSTKSAGFFNLF